MADSIRGAAAVIVAGGTGRRFSDGGPPKQYRTLLGQPLLSWTLRPFIEHPSIGPVVVVLPAADVDAAPVWLAKFPVRRVAGGSTRSESVYRGLEALHDSSAEIVLIHDGARPFVTASLIDRILRSSGDEGANRDYGVIPGLPVTDTLKEVDASGTVIATVARERYWRVQTPQAFPLETIREVHRRAVAEGVTATDDAALFERYGRIVRLVDGDPDNIKVTVPIDFQLAELLASRLLPASVESIAGGDATNPAV